MAPTVVITSYSIHYTKLYELMKQNEDKDCLYDFWPTLSSDRAFTIMGGSVGATPDGRGEREPLSENQSPVEGADVNGITAMLNSAARIPYHKVSGGPLNIKIHPNVTKGEEGLLCFSSLLLSYMQNKGMQAQVNILDRDMLIAAQKDVITSYSIHYTKLYDYWAPLPHRRVPPSPLRRQSAS